MCNSTIEMEHSRFPSDKKIADNKETFSDLPIKIIFFPAHVIFFACINRTHIIMCCDLGNQSDVKHVTFSVFYLIEVLIRRGTFC